MGNICCSSKKRKTIYDGSDELNAMGDDLTIKGGLLGDSQKLFDDDEIFEAYVDENLGDPEENKDAAGLLTFEYFLKVY